jgi:hypothetical protein
MHTHVCVNLSLALHGYDTWSLTFKEKYILQISEIKVPIKIYKIKGMKGSGNNHQELFHL